MPIEVQRAAFGREKRAPRAVVRVGRPPPPRDAQIVARRSAWSVRRSRAAPPAPPSKPKPSHVTVSRSRPRAASEIARAISARCSPLVASARREGSNGTPPRARPWRNGFALPARSRARFYIVGPIYRLTAARTSLDAQRRPRAASLYQTVLFGWTPTVSPISRIRLTGHQTALLHAFDSPSTELVVVRVTCT